MSLSKPVIGTKVGEIPKVLDDYKCGFLCENENSNDFSHKLMLLIRNRELRQKNGESRTRKSKIALWFRGFGYENRGILF